MLRRASWEGVRLRTRSSHVAPSVPLASVDCLLGAGTAGTPREPVATFYIFIILFYILYSPGPCVSGGVPKVSRVVADGGQNGAALLQTHC